MNPIEANAYSLLKLIVEAAKEQYDNTTLQQMSNLSPRDLSDAVEYLGEISAVKVLKTLGTAPFAFRSIFVKPRGRYLYHEVESQKEKGGVIMASVPARPLHPIGSPYGFEAMADIFISYSHEDEARIRDLVRTLEEKGWSIFWDRRVPTGKTWQSYIGQALSDAKCVVVAWSHHSITSEWVLEEANVAKKRRVILPVLLDAVDPPFGFTSIQAADLTDYKPGTFSLRFDQLIQDIAGIVGGQAHTATSKEERILHPSDEVLAQREFRNSIGMKFVLIPTGSFTMGSRMSSNELVDRFGGEEEWYKREKPHHAVKIERPFYLQTTPVIQGQWQRVMGNNPANFKDCGDDCPIENVSWEDAQAFMKKLNQVEKRKDYRLPSEAEWEYTCRAGSETEFSFGDDAERLKEFAWYSKNSENKTHPVGEKKPNAWGLYDMHGNVWEWVEDDWHESYNGAPADGGAWVDNPRGSDRVGRGGSWGSGAHNCQSATRHYYWPDLRSNAGVGFRLSCSVALGP